MKVAQKYLVGFFSFVIALLIVFTVVYQQSIADWWVLRSYEPSPRISQIADSTSMSEEGRRLFYLHDPQIEDSSEFNTHCTIREVSIVLGCFNGRKIYIFNVEDPRLVGVQEVTAAHEMLHAAYDRLSASEQKEIDTLTLRQFQRLGNERIATTVAAYRARDPSIVANELHSILATEVRQLDPDLEKYYSRYFTDRTKVVEFSEKYEQVFSDIRAKVERLDAELTLLKAQIDTLEADLSNRADSLTTEKSELDFLRETDIPTYNARVPTFNASIGFYNADVERYTGLIEEYNRKVETRNQTTLEQNDLIESLSSRAPAL